MKQFIDYIESVLPDQKGDKLMFKFKRKVLDEMNERYLEVSQRGISNQKVISDLIISEHADLKAEYKAYYEKETSAAKEKRRAIFNVAGSVIYIIGLIIVYLAISFITQNWAQSWLIVVDGILLWVAYLLSLGVCKISSMRRIFHVFARVLLALDVMVVTVAMFLFALVMSGFSRSWVIIIAGIAMMFVADGAYAKITGQKFAIINYLIYIPVVATMLFIIICALGIVAWDIGWLLIIASLFADICVMYASAARNKRYKQEVIDTWKEN